MFMPPRTFKVEEMLRLDAIVTGKWFNKNNTIKHKDITNLEKILVDAIAEKYLEGRDEQFFERTIRKEHSMTQEQVFARIYRGGFFS